jgi:hypothetical protein
LTRAPAPFPAPAETACLQRAVLDAFVAAGRANESDFFLRDTDRRYLRLADVRNLVDVQLPMHARSPHPRGTSDHGSQTLLCPASCPN